MERFISNGPLETENIGKMLGEKITDGVVIAFKGGLGMGKTCFTRGLALGLGSADQVTSPTFALVNEYLSGRIPLYHFDMYRISGWEDLYSTGFFDYIDEGAVLACEWSENIENALPENTIFVEFNRIDDLTREIIIRKQGEHF